MGALRMAGKRGRRRQNFFTETVKKLWKNDLLATCKLTFLLRIWHFAQDFVKVLAGPASLLYANDNNIITGIEKSERNIPVRPR
jgi:hypothetical protein